MNRVSTVTDYRGRTVKYGYDELGNLISLTYAGGEIVRYSYYPDGILKSMVDGAGRRTEYTYDSSGHLLTTTKPDGSVETNEYSESGRLTGRKAEAGGEVTESCTYTHDGWGETS